MNPVYKELVKSGIYEVADPEINNLKFTDHKYPWSISNDEFNFVFSHIKQMGYKAGYDLATGCGISALAMGLALKDNGGRLVTMDAYVEENSGELYYEVESFPKSVGYKRFLKLIKRFRLSGVVRAEVGCSPQHTSDRLGRTYDLSTDKLDVVFIDAMHDDKSLVEDFEATFPYLDSKFTLFIHDAHSFSMRIIHQVMTTVDNRGKGRCKLVVPAGKGCNLIYITNDDLVVL